MSLPGRGLHRLYWGACGLLLLVGIAGVVGVFLVPPERFDESGQLIGEMPPEFGVALFLATLGMVGLLAGLAVMGLARLRRCWHPRIARRRRMR